jgi:hypothetical protein
MAHFERKTATKSLNVRGVRLDFCARFSSQIALMCESPIEPAPQLLFLLHFIRVAASRPGYEQPVVLRQLTDVPRVPRHCN